MVGLSRKTIDADLAVLKTSNDRERLERAARDLAASGAPAAIHELGRLFAGRDLLARVDDLHDPSAKTRRLGAVLAELARHPSAETGALAVALADVDVQLAAGLCESLFDDRRREWFGPARSPPRPPPWQAASTEALAEALRVTGIDHTTGSLRGVAESACLRSALG